MYYDAGVTEVAPSEMWKALDIARRRGLRLRRVSFDANGLGETACLSIAVEVDGTGRWKKP